jgi:hypothetical protein
MYAAILSEHDVSFADIKSEITKLGWHVAGKVFEQHDDCPSDVMVWVLYGWKSLGYPNFPCKGFVRIASDDPPSETSFVVINSGWLVTAYYQILMWAELQREKLRRRYRKIVSSRSGLE